MYRLRSTLNCVRLTVTHCSRSGSLGHKLRPVCHSSIVAMDYVNSSSPSSSGLLAAVTQMTSTADKEENFNVCKTLVETASVRGAEVVFLPEGCDYIAESKHQSVILAEPLSGPTVTRYKQLAKDLGIWISLGGVHIKEEIDDRISNSHVLINNEGDVAGVYQKTHLFDVHIPEKNICLMESTYVRPGAAIQPPIRTPLGLLGLSICYDIRFPELSLLLRRLGAQILTYPSAFTITTGLAHWEPLLKARAIESQCYVIAAAQTGQHNANRSSYGHAMIVDPWGSVVAQVSEGTNIAISEINLSYLNKVRQDMPVFTHRRTDLYHLANNSPSIQPRLMEMGALPSMYSTYKFGHVQVPGSCIFAKTLLSHAFVNKMPITSGHCLVTPERPANRFTDLTSDEISDLGQLALYVLKVIYQTYEVLAAQIVIQDGAAAGQTIEHVHMHIVPWLEGITMKHLPVEYRLPQRITLKDHDTKDKDRTPRTEEHMAAESTKLRSVSSALLITNSVNIKNQDIPTSDVVIDVSSFDEDLYFDNYTLKGKSIVLQSNECFAFYAPKPILPGHTYVTFKNPISSLKELSPSQVSELLQVTRKVQETLECQYNAEASTIIMAEGKDAGQHIEQVHVHVIPRLQDDLQDNDDIYLLVRNHNLLLHMSSKPIIEKNDDTFYN